jgi:hypothetical protein
MFVPISIHACGKISHIFYLTRTCYATRLCLVRGNFSHTILGSVATLQIHANLETVFRNFVIRLRLSSLRVPRSYPDDILRPLIFSRPFRAFPSRAGEDLSEDRHAEAMLQVPRGN